MDPKDSKLKVEKISDLASNDVKRIAIANPDHAPYGTAAREALQAVGIWDAVKEKLVYGDNIRQTLQFAETGNVDVANRCVVVEQRSEGQWTLIPAELHKPINQALAVIKGTKDEQTARAFADFIAGPEGQSILAKYGFESTKTILHPDKF
jgi:molybdate transport system substrate-binding protein